MERQREKANDTKKITLENLEISISIEIRSQVSKKAWADNKIKQQKDLVLGVGDRLEKKKKRAWKQ